MKEKILKDKELLDLLEQKRYLRARLINIFETIYKKASKHKIQIGYNECNKEDNPFGKCIYELEDITRDSCIFCGKPEDI